MRLAEGGRETGGRTIERTDGQTDKEKNREGETDR